MQELLQKFQELLQKLDALIQQLDAFKQQFQMHEHNGLDSQQVKAHNIFDFVPSQFPVATATIATTGNTDGYLIAPRTGIILSIDFSATDALATSDTNYITFTITNLGQAGAGSTALLSTADTNTTKATGGTAISANTKRALIISTTPNNLQVIEGDRLRIRAAATGTLANAVTFPTYILRFK